MASCDILDFKCIYMNEIVGDTVLAVIIFAIMYFVITSKMKLGFDTTMVFSIPLILIGGLMFAGFSVLFAFMTVLIGWMLAWLFGIMIQGR